MVYTFTQISPFWIVQRTSNALKRQARKQSRSDHPSCLVDHSPRSCEWYRWAKTYTIRTFLQNNCYPRVVASGSAFICLDCITRHLLSLITWITCTVEMFPVVPPDLVFAGCSELYRLEDCRTKTELSDSRLILCTNNNIKNIPQYIEDNSHYIQDDWEMLVVSSRFNCLQWLTWDLIIWNMKHWPIDWILVVKLIVLLVYRF